MKVEKMVVEGLRSSGTRDDQGPSSYVRDQQEQDIIGGEKGECRNNRRNGLQKILEKGREERDQDQISSIRRHSSILEEVRRQTLVFFDDEETDEVDEEATATTDEEEEPVMISEEHGTRVGWECFEEFLQKP